MSACLQFHFVLVNLMQEHDVNQHRAVVRSGSGHCVKWGWSESALIASLTVNVAAFLHPFRVQPGWGPLLLIVISLEEMTFAS